MQVSVRKAQQLNLLQQGERGVFIEELYLDEPQINAQSNTTSFNPLELPVILDQLKMAMGTVIYPMSLRLPSGGGITVYPYQGRGQQGPHIEVFTIWKESLPEQTQSLLGLNIRESEIVPRLQPDAILRAFPFLLTGYQNKGVFSVFDETGNTTNPIPQQGNSRHSMMELSADSKLVFTPIRKALFQQLLPQVDMGELSNTMQLLETGFDAINSGEVHPTELQSDVGNLLQMIVAASGGGSLTTTATGGQIVFNPKMVGNALAKTGSSFYDFSTNRRLASINALDIGNGQQLLLNFNKGSIEIGFKGLIILGRLFFLRVMMLKEQLGGKPWNLIRMAL